MEIVVEAIGFNVKHGRNAPWLAGKIEKAEKSRDYWAAQQAEHRAECLARMRPARLAKRITASAEVAGHAA